MKNKDQEFERMDLSVEERKRLLKEIRELKKLVNRHEEKIEALEMLIEFANEIFKTNIKRQFKYTE